MTRENAIREIKEIANDLQISFEAAAIEGIYMFYEATGLCEEQVEAEFGDMSSESMINTYINLYS